MNAVRNELVRLLHNAGDGGIRESLDRAGSELVADLIMDSGLVVIDPEDRQAAFRLIDLYFVGRADDLNAGQMQRALHEFASPTPPKRVWTDGDVIQSEATNLVWTREDDRWLPANGKTVSVGDNKVSMWVESLGGACRVLREQAIEVTP